MASPTLAELQTTLNNLQAAILGLRQTLAERIELADKPTPTPLQADNIEACKMDVLVYEEKITTTQAQILKLEKALVPKGGAKQQEVRAGLEVKGKVIPIVKHVPHLARPASYYSRRKIGEQTYKTGIGSTLVPGVFGYMKTPPRGASYHSIGGSIEGIDPVLP